MAACERPRSDMRLVPCCLEYARRARQRERQVQGPRPDDHGVLWNVHKLGGASRDARQERHQVS